MPKPRAPAAKSMAPTTAPSAYRVTMFQPITSSPTIAPIAKRTRMTWMNGVTANWIAAAMSAFHPNSPFDRNVDYAERIGEPWPVANGLHRSAIDPFRTLHSTTNLLLKLITGANR